MDRIDRDGFLGFAASVLGVPAPSLALSTAMGSVPEWDSVAHLRLALELESHYGASMPIGTIASARTLGDFYDWFNSPPAGGGERRT